MHVVVRDQIVRSKFDGANSYEQIAKLTTNDNNRTTTYHTRPPGGLLLNSRAQDDCPISTCLQCLSSHIGAAAVLGHGNLSISHRDK